MPDPTERFSSRVHNYIKYRPRYPPVVLETLEAACGLSRTSVVADVGAGTGFLTELFARYGNEVFAIEPNQEMREAGARLLAGYPHVRMIDGRAEETTLPGESVDFVVAGQAFHWFEAALTRTEFQRILRPGGWVALVWNVRDAHSTPFLAAYERLLEQFGTDYKEVVFQHGNEAALADFYGANGFRKALFENHQTVDYAGLQGRLLSSSYIPAKDDPAYGPMLESLARIFQEHQESGQVDFAYMTTLFYGHLAG